MQPTKTRKILALALGALAYIVVMMLIHILFEHKEFTESLTQTAISGVISGLLFWGLLSVIKP